MSAQAPIVVPSGYANLEGNSNNAFPWNRGASSMRVQFIHDSSNFASPGVPIRIQRLRYRADSGSGSWSGGTWPNVRIDMATATADHTMASATFANNLSSDLVTVYQGPVTVLAGSTSNMNVPGPWYIDIPLTTPFVYNPASGSDLAVDIRLDGSGWTGTSAQTDSVSVNGPHPARCTRIYDQAGMTSASGTLGPNYGPVCEFSYLPAIGYAYSVGYGEGCVDAGNATFYELFAVNTFDLSNRALQLLPTGNGYLVLPAAPQWYTPTSLPLVLPGNGVTAGLPLGFALSYPGGSTNTVFAASNGFVWAQSSNNPGCCDGNPPALRSQGTRWAPLWTDLNPLAGGTVHFDAPPGTGAAFVTFDRVPEEGTNNLSSFQIAFFSSGIVEYRYRACSVGSHLALTGWSPGSDNLDPGSTDLSAVTVLTTQPDYRQIRHEASGRPVLGGSMTLQTLGVPATAAFGATVFGLGKLDPGLSLASIGMPTCFQYTTSDASAIWFPVGAVGSTTFVLPNDPGLAGIRIASQGLALVPGRNALGALATNGVDLHIDLN